MPSLIDAPATPRVAFGQVWRYVPDNGTPWTFMVLRPSEQRTTDAWEVMFLGNWQVGVLCGLGGFYHLPNYTILEDVK